jgi:hypothetical protein
MPRLLLAAGTALLLVAAVLAVVLRHHASHPAASVTVSLPAHTTTPTTTAAPTTTTAPPPPPPTTTAAPPPTPVAMSWDDAGALVVHPDSVDPAQLGQEMRSAGFGWLAVDLANLDGNWIDRFRTASGLPVGGWSVLQDDPATDAAAAAQSVQQNGLTFYIADAEQAYAYTQGGLTSDAGYAASKQFVDAFRAAEPTLPAAVSSFCRPDQHDLDWSAWVAGGFEFLPQAYVNDFGLSVAPAACVLGAAKWFPRARVHPTIGSYSGVRGIVSPARWIALLRAAHTTGFSIYPAEAGMSPESWQAYGAALAALAHPSN